MAETTSTVFFNAEEPWPATDDAELLAARALTDETRAKRRDAITAMYAFQEAAKKARSLMDLSPQFRDWQAAKERLKQAEIAERRSPVCSGSGTTPLLYRWLMDGAAIRSEYTCGICHKPFEPKGATYKDGRYCGQGPLPRHGWDGEPR